MGFFKPNAELPKALDTNGNFSGSRGTSGRFKTQTEGLCAFTSLEALF
jgi:hypothetical protein